MVIGRLIGVLPFWARPYAWLVETFDALGLIEADVDIATSFIARHIRFYMVNERGERHRIP